MPYTIKDISKDSGLSIATISKYLNNKTILPESKLAIETSIKKLGYIPNKTAQTLRSRRTNIICILIPDVGDYFWGSLCGHIEEALVDHNFSTIITSYSPQIADVSDELRFLISSQVDGILFIPSDHPSTSLATLMQDAGIPFVCLDQSLTSPASDSVTSSNYQAAFDVMEHLIHNGHRRIGIISGHYGNQAIRERVKGCKASALQHHLLAKDLFFLSGEFSATSGASLFKEMISIPHPPSAIFMLGCNLTLGVILELNNLSLSLPTDFSLVSFDDDQIFSAFDPPITAMVQDFQEIAKQGVSLLLRRLSGDYKHFPETIMIPTHFIERASVKPNHSL